MGADGHVYMVRKQDIPNEYSNLDPERIQWRTKDLFGTEILWTYHDTDGRGDLWGTEFWEVPNRIEWLEQQIKTRSAPNYEPPKQTSSYGFRPPAVSQLQEELAALRASHTPEELEEAKLYAQFAGWLEARSEDWTVWT